MRLLRAHGGTGRLPREARPAQRAAERPPRPLAPLGLSGPNWVWPCRHRRVQAELAARRLEQRGRGQQRDVQGQLRQGEEVHHDQGAQGHDGLPERGRVVRTAPCTAHARRAASRRVQRRSPRAPRLWVRVSRWGHFADGSLTTVLPMKETKWYKDDLCAPTPRTDPTRLARRRLAAPPTLIAAPRPQLWPEDGGRGGEATLQHYRGQPPSVQQGATGLVGQAPICLRRAPLCPVWCYGQGHLL